MGLIYSRRRIRLPKKINNKNSKKYIITFIVLLIIMYILVFIIKGAYPIFKEICEDEAHSIATKISNNEAGKVMLNYNYNKLVDIEKDADGNISMVKTNIIAINEITSKIANNISESLENEESNLIYIRSGSFTGSKLLSGRGPKIPIRIASAGNVSTSLKSQFISTGINQTLHRIYLEVNCNVSILTPFNTISENVQNQILLAESVIVGNVPNGYYNLEGMTTNDSIHMIEN